MGIEQFVVSGVPAVYGRAFVLTHPAIGTGTRYDRVGVITVVDEDMNGPAYFDNLDTRFINPPTGWNAI